MRFITLIIAIAGACSNLSAGATADDQPVATDKTIEEYLSDAAPMLHHSCASADARYGDNEAELFDVIENMIAVSLYNRQIDMTTVQLDDNEREEIWREFADELFDACARDADQLLSGAIDTIIADLIQYY